MAYTFNANHEELSAQKSSDSCQETDTCYGNPVVTAPIIGPRSVDQLTNALKAVELILTKETLENLDEIWPGPGGHAPESYAW